jgi:hypothetical protein
MLMMFFKYFKIPPLSASLGRWSEDGEEGAKSKEHDVTENRIQVAVQKTYYLRRRTQEKGLEMQQKQSQTNKRPIVGPCRCLPYLHMQLKSSHETLQ